MSEHYSIRECPICANSSISVLHTQKFAQTNFKRGIESLPSTYDIVTCCKCGFVYADTTFDQSGYDKYYEECSKYEGQDNVSSGGMSPSDLLRYKRVIIQLKDFVDKDITILDIGCANGGLLMELKTNGYVNLFGLDPSQTCVGNVNELNIRAFNGSLLCNELKGKEKYGLIILSHVLEHIRDINQAMEAALELLDESGYIYIEVPNAKEYESHFIVPFYYFDSEHINHFDKESLKNLFTVHGLQSVSCVEKSIQVSETQDYPAVSVIGRKQKIREKKELIHASTKDSIIGYVERCRQDKKYSYINNMVNDYEPIVIWGAGSYTSRLLGATDLNKCNIQMFIDNDENKQGMKLMDKNICGADKLNGFNGKIIIASAIHSREIVNQIGLMGLNNEIIIL